MSLAGIVSLVIPAVCFALAVGAAWLLATGMTDIDDVILNALGAALGFALHRIFTGTKRIFPASKN